MRVGWVEHAVKITLRVAQIASNAYQFLSGYIRKTTKHRIEVDVRILGDTPKVILPDHFICFVVGYIQPWNSKART